MSKIVQSVPYGYEPPKDQPKGTLIYYDSFEHTMDEELDDAAEMARVPFIREIRTISDS